MRWSRSIGRLMAIACAVACGPSLVLPESGSSDSSGSGTSDPATSDAQPTVPPGQTTTMGSSTAAPDDGGTTAMVSSSSGDGTSGSDAASTGRGCPTVIECDGSIFACGDGSDNDDDGLVDLDDPECISPCDDVEEGFGAGLPGDEFDCRLDCFFDGNGGSGDDECFHDLSCDPLEPAWLCGYDPDPQCELSILVPSPQCIAFCEPFVPNGCDCFGCCMFQTPDGPKNLYLDPPKCSLADLGACTECTPVETCGNPCEPEACEICIGQTAPPRGCEAPGCVGGSPCTSHCDCEPGGACITGCCIPPPPG